MSRTIPPLPQYAFMALYSVKKSKGTTLHSYFPGIFTVLFWVLPFTILSPFSEFYFAPISVSYFFLTFECTLLLLLSSLSSFSLFPSQVCKNSPSYSHFLLSLLYLILISPLHPQEQSLDKQVFKAVNFRVPKISCRLSTHHTHFVAQVGNIGYWSVTAPSFQVTVVYIRGCIQKFPDFVITK